MSFACPECGDPASLRITASIELPSDSRSDDIALQLVRCARCGFRAAAVYEESRRGGLDSEAVDHRGYRVSRQTLDWLVAQIATCPAPSDCGCGCETHRRLGQTDEFGRWSGLAETAGSFPMHLSGR
jgi:DNA-directed RNA polymerase subunit RPC12/RpoP